MISDQRKRSNFYTLSSQDEGRNPQALEQERNLGGSKIRVVPALEAWPKLMHLPLFPIDELFTGSSMVDDENRLLLGIHDQLSIQV